MKKLLVFVVITFFVGAFFLARPASAESLSLTPLEYTASLQQGDTKKGHVDIVNPEPRAVTIMLSVRGFRQADSDGGLDFFEDEKLRQGLILDLNEVELGPNEGVRVYFLLDSNKLPSGDVFAAIMARSSPKTASIGTNPAVEVGTLIMVTNGKTPDHHGLVETITVPWWQTGQELVAEMTVRNSDDPNGDALAFKPNMTIATWPYGSKKVDGPLIFAAHARTISYQQPGNYFGPIKLTATVDGHSKTAWLFAITGYWRFVVPFLVLLCALGFASIRYTLRRRSNRG